VRSYRILLVAGHSSLCQPRRRNESEGKEIAMITFAETYTTLFRSFTYLV
jgi:hypothetical protein